MGVALTTRSKSVPIRPPRTDERLKLQAFAGARIREAREQAGFTQRELSVALGFTHTWLSNVESGANSIDAHDLQRIADLVGYPVEYFLRREYTRAAFRRPATRFEWDIAYPDDKALARLHWELDQFASTRGELSNNI